MRDTRYNTWRSRLTNPEDDTDYLEEVVTVGRHDVANCSICVTIPLPGLDNDPVYDDTTTGDASRAVSSRHRERHAEGTEASGDLFTAKR